MILLIRQESTWEELTPLLAYCQSEGVDVQETYGFSHRIFNLLGDTSRLDADRLLAFDAVMDLKRLQAPYRKASRFGHPQDTSFCVKGACLGGGAFSIIAGPSSVESEEQICSIAAAVKEAGAGVLRGGAFKPRSSPYAFAGMQKEGIRLLLIAGRQAGLPVISEIMETAQLDLFADVDIIQVGARNMQNFELLRELGRSEKPVLLKRGLSSTYDELLMSAEYLMAGGNESVVLCERGIRTFETRQKCIPDVCAIPIVKELSHLPVIMDPSHGTGERSLVPPMALAGVAAGTDGLMLEVHNNPEQALCDGRQALTPDAFSALLARVCAVRDALRE